MTQSEVLARLGVSTFNMTQARIQQLHDKIDAMVRNDASSSTFSTVLGEQGLSHEEVERVLRRLRGKTERQHD